MDGMRSPIATACSEVLIGSSKHLNGAERLWLSQALRVLAPYLNDPSLCTEYIMLMPLDPPSAQDGDPAHRHTPTRNA